MKAADMALGQQAKAHISIHKQIPERANLKVSFESFEASKSVSSNILPQVKPHLLNLP